MTFLPEGYTTPQGNYAKLSQGDNTFRILSSAIVGYSYWNTDKKPVRSREEPMSPVNMRPDDKIKHFWAFTIWNYDANKVQILELTQKSIQEAIRALVMNPKWGDPKGYDITISRDGQGLETTYNVMPNPHSPLDQVIANQSIQINLEALYDGGDPFEGAESKPATLNATQSPSEPRMAPELYGEPPTDDIDINEEIPF